jgi:hypothetical protein
MPHKVSRPHQPGYCRIDALLQQHPHAAGYSSNAQSHQKKNCYQKAATKPQQTHHAQLLPARCIAWPEAAAAAAGTSGYLE